MSGKTPINLDLVNVDQIVISDKFHSMSVYDEKYIKAKVREFNSVIKTNVLSDKIRKESMH